ncbi:MAG: hypothetical protein ACLSGS_04225 [Adlercreutzia sp.]
MNLGREGIVIAVGAVVLAAANRRSPQQCCSRRSRASFWPTCWWSYRAPLDAAPRCRLRWGSSATGPGPVGGYAFLFVIVSFIASRAFSVLDNDAVQPVTISSSRRSPPDAGAARCSSGWVCPKPR